MSLTTSSYSSDYNDDLYQRSERVVWILDSLFINPFSSSHTQFVALLPLPTKK